MPHDLFSSWLQQSPPTHDGIRVYVESQPARAAVWPALRELVVDHFVGLASVAKMGGFTAAAKVIENSLPQSKQTRSGDFGEMLATEYLDNETQFAVPIRKLRWKDEQDMPMRGNDVVAIDTTGGRIRVAKGESKSAATMSASTIAGAAEGLDKHDGMPNPSTLSFIAKRLYEQGRDAEGRVFTELQTDGALRPDQVTQIVVTLSENDPTSLLADCPPPARSGPSREGVGLVVNDHSDLIAAIFTPPYGPES